MTHGLGVSYTVRLVIGSTPIGTSVRVLIQFQLPCTSNAAGLNIVAPVGLLGVGPDCRPSHCARSVSTASASGEVYEPPSASPTVARVPVSATGS